MDSSLTNLRNKLKTTNLAIFELFQRRKNMVAQIQSLKTPKEFYPHWDAKVEIKLLTELMPELEQLDLYELLSFSLLMQSHACLGNNQNYPNWFERVHLKNKSQQSLLACINPTIIYVLLIDEFNTLDLEESFKKFYD